MDAYSAARLPDGVLARMLDDPTAGPCGRRAPCKGRPEALRRVPEDLIREAIPFSSLRPADRIADQWPTERCRPTVAGRIAADRPAEPGRALCIGADSDWGRLVLRGK